MVITTLGWIALGLIGAGAVAAIITYWDEIVNWAKSIFDTILSRGKIFVKWVDGYLKAWCSGIDKNGSGGTTPPVIKPATEDEIWKLYYEGVISAEERDTLLRGGTISTNVK